LVIKRLHCGRTNANGQIVLALRNARAGRVVCGMSPGLFVSIRSCLDAEHWVRAASIEIGPGFHPDTPSREYVNVHTGAATFTAVQREAFDAARMTSLTLLGDRVYAIALSIQRYALFGDRGMDEQTAKQLAAIVGGEAWQSGGGIWLVAIHNDDGTIVVLSGDSVCEYESEEAFDESRPSKTILLGIPESGDLYVIVDLEGTVYYLDSALRRGWRYEEDAQHEAAGVQSRLGGHFMVVKQRDLES